MRPIRWMNRDVPSGTASTTVTGRYSTRRAQLIGHGREVLTTPPEREARAATRPREFSVHKPMQRNQSANPHLGRTAHRGHGPRLENRLKATRMNWQEAFRPTTPRLLHRSQLVFRKGFQHQILETNLMGLAA
jgi:hypothetical protein